MKKLQLSIIASLMCFGFFGQLTYVPDDAFEAYIENFMSAADNGNVNDNYVITAGLTHTMLNFGGLYNVADLTGIQDFLNPFEMIGFDNCNITELDLSNNTFNQMTTGNGFNLIITSAPYLTSIKMPHNEICFSIGECPFLSSILFQNDNILYKGSILMSCNSLTHFDISNIADVSLGSGINISYNPNLSCVNLKNGKCNKWAEIAMLYDPKLFCVEVDDPAFCLNAESIDTWNWIDLSTNPELCHYSTYCSCSAAINETELKTVSISPNPTSSSVSIKVPTVLVGKCWSLYDQTGRLQQSGVYTGTESEIILESYNPGIYIMRSDETEPIKIIKN